MRHNLKTRPIELRDTVVLGFLCKNISAGRKVFMLQYRTMAQEWLAKVRQRVWSKFLQDPIYNTSYVVPVN